MPRQCLCHRSFFWNYLWAKSAGIMDDVGNSLSVDCLGNFYVTGFFTGTATFGDITLISSGVNNRNTFVAKMNASSVDWIRVVQVHDTSDNVGESGVAQTFVSSGKLINPIFPGISSGPVFSGLLPSIEYDRNNNGELVSICRWSKCNDPQLSYFGTAGSTTCMIINTCNCLWTYGIMEKYFFHNIRFSED